MHNSFRRHLSSALLITLLFACWATPATAQYLRLRDICRVKGQESHTLHGMGLVVGLQGTGDGDTPTMKALAQTMKFMGNPLSIDAQRQPVLTELENAKNVALVFVTATVPAEGARQGELLNVLVNAISAKSLEGGHLMITPLSGPRPQDPRADPLVFGHAQGPLSKDKNGPLTAGQVHNGCRLGTNIANTFVKDGKITLVVDKHHASFQTAREIEQLLNDPNQSGFGLGRDKDGVPPTKAMDQINIQVRILPEYEDDHVAFASDVLDLQIIPPRHDARVVIDKRNGVIIVGDNVRVGRVAVSHKNIVIQTGATPDDGPLFVVDQESDTNTTRLQALVDALNGLKVSTEDIIEIIEGLETSGDLYGKLIVK